MKKLPSAGTDKATDERALFEKWAGSRNFGSRNFMKLSHGGYVNPEINKAWSAWQARAALAAVPASEPDMRKLLAARAEGRADAVSIIMAMDPEDALNDCMVGSGPCPASGEYDTHWDEAKLREKFSAGDKLFDMELRLDTAFYEYQEARMVIQYEAEQRRAAPLPAVPPMDGGGNRFYSDTSIRDSCDYADFCEDLLRLSEPGLNRKQAKVIRSNIVNTIDARVRAFAYSGVCAAESIADDPEFKKLASDLWASRQDSMLAAFNDLARYIDNRMKGPK